MSTSKAQFSLRIHAVWNFVVRCLDGNEILQLKAIYLDWHVSPTCQFAESVLSLHVHLFKSKCRPPGMVLQRFCLPVHRCGSRLFCDKSF